MTQGLFVTRRHRPTLGALYVGAVGLFAVLVLALVGAGLASPLAVVLVAVPLGPLGIVTAALTLPVLRHAPSPAFALLVLAVVLAIAAVNVMAGALISFVAGNRLEQIREHVLVH